MFNPEVICKCCKNVMPVQDMEIRKQEFIKASPEMTLHLKERHGVDYDNWMSLKSWLVNHAGDYCKVPKLGVIYKCKKCEIPFKNGIMFVKHLFDKHRCDGKLDKFPWINIPNELRSLYSTVREDTTLSSDIADRSGSSSQGRSGVSSESTQFSRKRKEEVLKKMSETLEEVVKKMSEMPEISTQIEEPLYKRRKYSSTDNSD
ncbi:uncharacterized protein LOC105248341 [Camponotus floridanus]|nr:uncharacterized protein LOC105248341 [Camponotus floridanus]